MEASPRLRVMVLYVGRPPSFIQGDLDLLRDRFEVDPVSIGRLGSLLLALRHLRSADCLICWFGSLRFLPLVVAARLLGIPVVVIAGGYDLANLPEIGYGNMRPGMRRVLGRRLFRAANVVACVSRSAEKEARDAGAVSPERLRVVYHAFDPGRIGADLAAGDKEPLVLTVAGIDDSTLKRKGLLTVAHTSRLMPDVRFIIAGRCSPELRARLVSEGGPGLVVPGYVSDAELDGLFRRARVYFQPSLHEAFGCSVAEAMLFNCTPVVTASFALPEVVGPCGVYVPPESPAAAVPVLREALAGAMQLPETPRQRIRHEFPAALRQKRLTEIVEEVCASTIRRPGRESPPSGGSGRAPE